jgi:hypothetical protein
MPKAMKDMTLQEWFDLVKSLRAEMDAASVRLYEALLFGEGHFREAWKSSGKSFARWCQDNALCDAGWFERYRLARQDISAADASALGLHGTIGMGQVQPDRRAEVRAKIMEYVGRHEHPPGERATREIVGQFIERVEPQKVTRAQLEAKVERLEKENAALRAKVATLETKLGNKAKTTSSTTQAAE